MNIKDMPIGFFDSGVGGLSVLREAIKLMPNEHYIYFGDSKNAPYGVKTVEEVRKLTCKAVEFLINKKCKAIVIACNTATSAAVEFLRAEYKDLPIIGIEPAVKPAVEMHRNGDVIIMATPVTLKQQKFKKLIERYDKESKIIPMPCPGLVEFIESGNVNGKEVENYLEEKFSNFKMEEIAAIVLGCTHYPFVKETIKKVVGNAIPIIDGGAGTSKELKRRLIEKDLLSHRVDGGEIELYNSLNEQEILDVSKELLNK